MKGNEITLGKVVAFITRDSARGRELLLLAHPFAGNQLPAGTVEENETVRAAVLREVAEEAGLLAPHVAIKKFLGDLDEPLPEAMRIVARATKVYARPNTSSFAWAEFRRGVWVRVERAHETWSHVTYEEPDQFPNANYTTYCITGWVPNETLCAKQRRAFFHLVTDETRDTWTQFSDNHTFRLFWSPLAAPAEIVCPQNQWLAHVKNNLGYQFE